jgi:ABC-type nitrate/sulfonate/bicarbonate transport system permease component
MKANTKAKAGSLTLVMLIWLVLSLIYPPLVIPGIPAVGLKILEILSRADLLQTVLTTLIRLVTALSIGIIAGFAAGLICSVSRTIRHLMEPIIGILQVIPPVSILILAIIWFGYNGKPAIFIVVLAVFPTMAISVQSGIMSIDRKLLEMGKIFKLSRRSMLTDIIIPSITPALASGWKISLGLACKTMVMAEVLTTPTGIGGALATARMDLEPETVIAWTVITVMIFNLIDMVSEGLRIGSERAPHRRRAERPVKTEPAQDGRGGLKHA